MFFVVSIHPNPGYPRGRKLLVGVCGAYYGRPMSPALLPAVFSCLAQQQTPHVLPSLANRRNNARTTSTGSQLQGGKGMHVMVITPNGRLTRALAAARTWPATHSTRTPANAASRRCQSRCMLQA
jgi:hypothetical protein